MMPPALRPEVRDGKRRELRRRHEVDLQRAPPGGAPGRGPGGIGMVGGERGLGLVDGGVVDQHVDAAAPGERGLPERLRRVVGGEIGLGQVAALGRGLRQRRRRLAARVVVQDDVGAALQQRAHAAGADAARGAGDQHHLALDADRPVRRAILRHGLPRRSRQPTKAPTIQQGAAPPPPPPVPSPPKGRGGTQAARQSERPAPEGNVKGRRRGAG